ncbi:MAG: branched-chain amino acid ABC transporter permease [SAR324 cluster bacterium]|nr:branched-chain amino acid ABC transporter permease [SAR324 cluster bacterium]
MIYRQTGLFVTSYAKDMRMFPIPQDRWGIAFVLFVAYVIIPVFASEYWISTIFTVVLIYSLAAIGLNLLTGYCGQLSLGQAGFMAVGAYAAFNFAVRLPGLPVVVNFLLGGVCAALVGLLFGLPSLRIKGFYLAVATLAAQFTIEWVIVSFNWFAAGNMMGAIDTPRMVILGWHVESVTDKYLLTLSVVVVLAFAAKNLVRGEIGRSWMAIRDLDVAAEMIGIRLFPQKLLAFMVSAFYAGVAGALLAFCYLGSLEITSFELLVSFRILGMIIVGGLGTITGSFLGAAFIILLPILISNLAAQFATTQVTQFTANAEVMLFGALIIGFLILEPLGLARLWRSLKDKLRLWPFPY